MTLTLFILNNNYRNFTVFETRELGREVFYTESPVFLILSFTSGSFGSSSLFFCWSLKRGCHHFTF